MKIVTVLGSPRKKGNTAGVLSKFESAAAQGGHEVERINLADKNVRGCTGCYSCKKPERAGHGCVLKDDAKEIFDAIAAADAVIYSTPLYCWCFSAQMKALLDRHISLVDDFETPKHDSRLAGKKAALLVTCEGPVEENADLIQIVFARMCGYLKIDVAGSFIVPGCGASDSLPAAADDVASAMAAALR
jgi:multimeric flavodoxin WrbA